VSDFFFFVISVGGSACLSPLRPLDAPDGDWTCGAACLASPRVDSEFGLSFADRRTSITFRLGLLPLKCSIYSVWSKQCCMSG
jgi:hypothetical protein